MEKTFYKDITYVKTGFLKRKQVIKLIPCKIIGTSSTYVNPLPGHGSAGYKETILIELDGGITREVFAEDLVS